MRMKLVPPNSLRKVCADGLRLWSAPFICPGKTPGLFLSLVANVTAAITHDCKMKSRPSCIQVGPRSKAQAVGSLGDTSGAPPFRIAARSPVAVDADRTSLSLGGLIRKDSKRSYRASISSAMESGCSWNLSLQRRFNDRTLSPA